MEPTSLRFAHAARALADAARSQGLVAPTFRSPPKVAGVDRTLRRHGGATTVAVVVRGRPWPAVLADMIEGIVVANHLEPPAAHAARAALWEALTPAAGDVAA